MVLNDSLPAQISKNFEHFWSFVNFWGKKQVFSTNGSRAARDPFIGQLLFGKTQHFWTFHANIHFLSNCQEISLSFGPPESQKISKK